jgi:thioester reductase-like protein
MQGNTFMGDVTPWLSTEHLQNVFCEVRAEAEETAEHRIYNKT